MATRKREGRPKAVVAPQFMPKTFGLWESPRNILVNYLCGDDPEELPGPSREIHANLQRRVDEMLHAVLHGADVRAVFDLTKKDSLAETRAEMRAKAMAAEVLRLIDDGATEADAKKAVAEAFSVTIRSAQRSFEAWKDELTARENFLDVYRGNLRRRKLIS